MMSEVKFYWQLILRRLPILIAIVMLCTALGLIQAIRLPATFSTEARLLVELPQIDFDDPTVDASVEEEIQIVRERLLTRANLLDIAAEFDVFEDYSARPPDQIVAAMQRATRIESTGGRNQATVITVSFDGRSGQIAADVVNEYVTRIINANRQLREERVGGTLDFFEQEVERLAGELDARSARISAFQSENADALPGEQPFRLQRQAVLQERLASSQRELSSLIDQRARIIEIYEQTGQVTAGEGALTDDQRQLRDLERELAGLLSIYSEEAPRIINLRRRIEALEAQIATTGGAEGPANPGQAVLDLQLGQIDAQITELEAVVAAAEAELADLESAIARTPLNAITLASLERDYENIRVQYDSAVARLAQASTGERIEVTARGQRITLIEAAAVPRAPSSPNRRLIALMGGMAGIGLAGALFVLLELLNRSVRRPAEISRALGIEPLVTVPYFRTRAERITRGMLRAASVAIVVIGIPGALWGVHTYYMPLDQLAEQVLTNISALI